MTNVCNGCKKDLEINAKPESKTGDWLNCYFCNTVRWCLIYVQPLANRNLNCKARNFASAITGL